MKLPKHILAQIDYWEDQSGIEKQIIIIHWKDKKWWQTKKKEFWFDGLWTRSNYELGELVKYYKPNKNYVELKEQLTEYFDSLT